MEDPLEFQWSNALAPEVVFGVVGRFSPPEHFALRHACGAIGADRVRAATCFGSRYASSRGEAYPPREIPLVGDRVLCAERCGLLDAERR